MRFRSIIILLVVFVAVGSAYYLISRPQQPKSTPARVYIWDIEEDDLAGVKVSLPKVGQSQSFIKIVNGESFPWYFDDPQRSAINTDRWGGGVPLLLSGPSADRIIADEATAAQLQEFGLNEPSMVLMLTLTDQSQMVINVGNSTPNGINYYVKAPGSNVVATVDGSWYQVVARLVTEPPYAQPVK